MHQKTDIYSMVILQLDYYIKFIFMKVCTGFTLVNAQDINQAEYQFRFLFFLFLGLSCVYNTFDCF